MSRFRFNYLLLLQDFPSHKTKGVFLFKHIQTAAISDCLTASANDIQTAFTAGSAAASIATSRLGMINFRQPILFHVSDRRRKLAAGVHFSIGQKCHEVEGGAAAVTGAPQKGFASFSLKMIFNKLSFNPRIGFFRNAAAYSFKKAWKEIFLFLAIRSRAPSPTVDSRLNVKKSVRSLRKSANGST